MVLFPFNRYYSNYNARPAQINSFKLMLLWQRGSTQNIQLHSRGYQSSQTYCMFLLQYFLYIVVQDLGFIPSGLPATISVIILTIGSLLIKN